MTVVYLSSRWKMGHLTDEMESILTIQNAIDFAKVDLKLTGSYGKENFSKVGLGVGLTKPVSRGPGLWGA